MQDCTGGVGAEGVGVPTHTHTHTYRASARRGPSPGTLVLQILPEKEKTLGSGPTCSRSLKLCRIARNGGGGGSERKPKRESVHVHTPPIPGAAGLKEGASPALRALRRKGRRAPDPGPRTPGPRGRQPPTAYLVAREFHGERLGPALQLHLGNLGSTLRSLWPRLPGSCAAPRGSGRTRADRVSLDGEGGGRGVDTSPLPQGRKGREGGLESGGGRERRPRAPSTP